MAALAISLPRGRARERAREPLKIERWGVPQSDKNGAPRAASPSLDLACFALACLWVWTFVVWQQQLAVQRPFLELPHMGPSPIKKPTGRPRQKKKTGDAYLIIVSSTFARRAFFSQGMQR